MQDPGDLTEGSHNREMDHREDGGPDFEVPKARYIELPPSLPSRTIIEPGERFDEGKHGPWLKFDSWDQARRVFLALPTHGHPSVMAARGALQDLIDEHNAQRGNKL